MVVDALVVDEKGNQRTTIQAEYALLVWDQQNHLQHFIREVDFKSNRESLLFVVPTPSNPEIREVPGGVFEGLIRFTSPRSVVNYPFSPYSLIAKTFLGSDRSAHVTALPTSEISATVRVLAQSRVAGMDTVTLDADTIDSLRTWFSQNGYVVGPSALEWLQSYVDLKWKLTIFKYAKGPEPLFGTKAIRMSFHADGPFYPYREPKDVPADSGRRLNLFTIASTPLSAPNSKFKQKFAAAYAEFPTLLGSVLPAGTHLESPWLQSFLDSEPSRVGSGDVQFSLNPEARTEQIPVIEKTRVIKVPYDLVLFVLVIGILLTRWARRKIRLSLQA